MSNVTSSLGTIEVSEGRVVWSQSTLVTLAKAANTAIRLACLCENVHFKPEYFRVANQLWAILFWAHRASGIFNVVYLISKDRQTYPKSPLTAERFTAAMAVVSFSNEDVQIPISKLSPLGMDAVVQFSINSPASLGESGYRNFPSDLTEAAKRDLNTLLRQVRDLNNEEILCPRTGAMRFLTEPQTTEFLRILVR